MTSPSSDGRSAGRSVGRTTRSRPPTCPDENELVLLADGMLADGRRASIECHLDGCAPCTLLVAELAGMAAPVRPVPARYKVIRQLGAGAMGVVWEAEDKHLGRRVALKFVRADDGAASRASDRDANRAPSRTPASERRTRLFREARALAQLRHPNVVNVYDVGESGDELFLALELVIGMDARTWRAAQPRSADEILAVWRQAAAGLAAVHRAGLVHRDIKPDNILVADDGRVLVGDFGLATDRGTTTGHANAGGLTNQHLTATGAIVGTPIYMAYELLLGEPATQKSDQFALCVSLWEALAGERPFAGPTLAAIATAMQHRPVIPPSRRPAEAAVFTALARGLDPSPAKRWPSVDALLAALASRPSPRARGPSRALWLALGAASIAAAATVAVLVWRDRSAASIAPSASVAPASAASAPAALPTTPSSNLPRDAFAGATPTEREPAPPQKSKATASIDRGRQREAGEASGRVSNWDEAMERATSKLGFGDGAACLRVLHDTPPTSLLAAVDTLRAKCMMKAGDCNRGRAVLEAASRATYAAPVVAEIVREADYAYCPLDADPHDRWTPRAAERLRRAVVAKTSCKPVLAFIAKHRLELADTVGTGMLVAQCYANDGDCDGARAALRKSFTFPIKGPSRDAEREQAADEAFAKIFPQCR